MLSTRCGRVENATGDLPKNFQVQFRRDSVTVDNFFSRWINFPGGRKNYPPRQRPGASPRAAHAGGGARNASGALQLPPRTHRARPGAPEELAGPITARIRKIIHRGKNYPPFSKNIPKITILRTLKKNEIISNLKTFRTG